MPIISEGLKKLAVVGMMGCSGMALLVFVQHGQRDGYPMEVPKVAVVFLEKILQGFVLERVLLLPFYWVDNDTRDVDIGLGVEYPFITAIATCNKQILNRQFSEK